MIRVDGEWPHQGTYIRRCRATSPRQQPRMNPLSSLPMNHVIRSWFRRLKRGDFALASDAW